MDITESSIAQLCIPTTSDAATQVPMTKTRSVSVSVHMKGRDKGKDCCIIIKFHSTIYIETQTDISHAKQNSVATQCNLLNAPPLEMFPQASASLDDSFATETEPEETDLDTSFCSKQEDYNTE